MPVRAVVFDLWDTIVDYPPDVHEGLQRRIVDRLGVEYDRYVEVWYAEEITRRRNTGPIAPCMDAACATLGVEADLDELLGWRRDVTLGALAPRDGALDTLVQLRARGVKAGLVSNCTEEVADVWPETSFADLFDATVFSATAGCAKPDAEIYGLANAALGVEPADALFVGDGANDELRGAADVGMTPVLIHRADEEPYWENVRDWNGLRITSIPQVLELVR